VGGGLAVQVGSIVAVGNGLARNDNPPHPIDKRVRNDMEAKAFLKPIKDD
jgi:hypothetical protein